MNTKRFFTAAAFAALPFLGLRAAPEPKSIPLELRNWANESLKEISVASSADAIAAQLLEAPQSKTLLAKSDAAAPESATPPANEAQPLFYLEFATEYNGDLIPDIRLVLANPEPKAVAPEAPSEA